MKITRGIENISFMASTAATLGSYDGVHLGHQDILHTLIKTKQDHGYSRSVVLTFDPHPQEILRKHNTDIQLLTTIGERLDLIAATGVDEAVIIEFSHQFSQISYAEFFNSVLADRLGTAAMVVGYDHAFGKNREGDIAHLRTLAEQRNISVTEVPPHMIGADAISSTKIRRALLSGNIGLANSYLGRQYQLGGVVTSGDKLGRTLGFPTANIQVPANKLIPKDGVYAGFGEFDKHRYTAAISIGTRPTIVDTHQRNVEALLLGFSGDLYNKTLNISLDSYLREQIKFDSLEDLKEQMKKDIVKIERLNPAR